MTPEGKIKKLVKTVLHVEGIMPASDAGKVTDAEGWYYMPSQNGFGVKGIPDFLGHCRGVFFGIETKAPKKEPTGFQALQIDAIRESGGAVFVVDGPETLEVFKEWVKRVKG